MTFILFLTFFFVDKKACMPSRQYNFVKVEKKAKKI